MVGMRGFEPLTTATPLRCATRLRHTPIKFNYIEMTQACTAAAPAKLGKARDCG